MEEGFWVNPCGFDLHHEDDDTDGIVDNEYLTETFDEAIRNAQVASKKIADLQKHVHDRYKHLDMNSLQNEAYDFLKVPDMDDNDIDNDQALQDALYLLQKYGVALEQMLEDTDKNFEREYYSLLKDTILVSTQLLCSIHKTILLLQLNEHKDAKRDVMPSHLRNVKEAGRAIRDFIVVKQYSKAAEHMTKLLFYLKMHFVK